MNGKKFPKIVTKTCKWCGKDEEVYAQYRSQARSQHYCTGTDCRESYLEENYSPQGAKRALARYHNSLRRQAQVVVDKPEPKEEQPRISKSDLKRRDEQYRQELRKHYLQNGRRP